MSTNEFSSALQSREEAAAELMQAAHALTSALVKFNAASDILLQEIPRMSLSAGERAKAKHASQWSEPAGTQVEAAQRIHAAIGAGRSAAGAIEHRLCSVLGNGLRNGSPAATLGLEFSQAAADALSAAVDVGRQRAPQTKPDNQFFRIIQAQSKRLRELTQEPI